MYDATFYYILSQLFYFSHYVVQCFCFHFVVQFSTLYYMYIKSILLIFVKISLNRILLNVYILSWVDVEFYQVLILYLLKWSYDFSFLADVYIIIHYFQKKFLLCNIYLSPPDYYYSIHTHSHLSNIFLLSLVSIYLLIDTLHFCYKQNF